MHSLLTYFAATAERKKALRGPWFAKLILAAAGSLAAIAPSHAAILFTDTLGDSLSQWNNPISAGKIVAAPSGGKALTFDSLQGGNNLLETKSAFASSTGSFTVIFDLYANCGHTNGCGAFFWANAAASSAGHWILSDTAFNGIANFADAPGWETISYTLAGSNTNLALEDWNGSAFAQPYSGADAIFLRNLILTDNSNRAAVNTLSVT